MTSQTGQAKDLEKNGFAILENVYSHGEVRSILSCIENSNASSGNFRKSADLFAIRQFLKEIPSVAGHIFNENLKQVLTELLGVDYFVVKSIYFDKPEQSNWFVAYHQDLTISVDKKIELDNYSHWTVKDGQFAVQPPLEILQNIYTVRIHLDDTDENNGALKVIPGSHLKNIYRPEAIDWKTVPETICRVPEGAIMIMRPLLLHASSRTISGQRRVIHLELSDKELPKRLQWSERQEIPQG